MGKGRQAFETAMSGFHDIIGETIDTPALGQDAGWKRRAATAAALVFGAECHLKKNARIDVAARMADFEACIREYGLPAPQAGGR
jgi:hypothetical protein